jgi:hypothetical protein
VPRGLIRRELVLAGLLPLLAVLPACSKPARTDSPASPGAVNSPSPAASPSVVHAEEAGPGQLNVGKGTCDPGRAEFKAGTLNFTIVNQGSAPVTVSLQSASSGSTVGSINVPVGATKTWNVNAPAGTYDLQCGGGQPASTRISTH